MQILLILDFVEYIINILCNEQSNQPSEYNAEHVAMQSRQYS